MLWLHVIICITMQTSNYFKIYNKKEDNKFEKIHDYFLMKQLDNDQI